MNLKKALYRLLCNAFTGSIIVAIFRNSIPSVRWPSFRFATRSAGVSRVTASSIFWGFYEQAEIRFVEKYFQGDVDVIELGSSLGVLSSHIIKKFQTKERSFVGVEANNNLGEVWKLNTNRHNVMSVSTELLTSAIHYNAATIHLTITGNTTESKVNSGSGVEIPACTLRQVVDRSSIREYALFCDIEGAEVEVFLHEDEVLKRCRYLFIELHEVQYEGRDYKVSDILKLVREKGFDVVDSYGPVFYCKNTNNGVFK